MNRDVPFGRDQVWRCPLSPEQILRRHTGPHALADVARTAAQTLRFPLDFPALRESLIPEDRIVLALAHDTPAAEHLVAAIWEELSSRGISPDHVRILQPATWDRERLDPRSALPSEVAARIGWTVFDPTEPDSTGYLGTSVGGERIYLARALLDADFILPIAAARYDTLFGWRGAIHVLFPGFSTIEAVTRLHKPGHQELRPEDERPLRQLAEEVAYLLGVQFTMEVIPAATPGDAAVILAGAADSVLRQGRKLLQAEWEVVLPERVDTVIAAVPTRQTGPATWRDVAAAAHAARQLVDRGGRIVLLTDVSAELPPGIEVLQQVQSPQDAIAGLASGEIPDHLAGLQLADAAAHSQIYLLGGPQGDVVEDLFMTPLASIEEVNRAIEGAEGCVILGGAQFAYGRIAPEPMTV